MSQPLMNSGIHQLNSMVEPRSYGSINSRKSARSKYSGSSSKNLDSQLSLMSVNSQPPSIPGRSQRILINKKPPMSGSTAAARRCFNRAKSSNRVVGSEQGFSAMSTDSSFSSFAHAASKPKKDMIFGTKQRRFDAKLELKEYFNNEPGPGTY